MKKWHLIPLLLSLLSLPLFTSCDDDDDFPGPGPYYPDTYIDEYLVGQWDLVRVNGDEVSGFDQHFFDFFSNGTGKYYYYDGGEQFWEWIEYYCYDNSYGTPTLHVDYESGSSLECAFGFNSDYTRLILQWNAPNGSLVTYEYAYTGAADKPRPAEANHEICTAHKELCSPADE